MRRHRPDGRGGATDPTRRPSVATERRGVTGALGGFLFSTNTFGVTSRADFVAYCRRVGELGYDTLFAADHLRFIHDWSGRSSTGWASK
ncbi:MAG: hypothetical protein ACRDNW_02685 [Trebonia sp.]